jgi:nicotinamidase-related amidase
MLTADNTVLLVVDIQGKLATLMHEKDRLYDAAAKILRGAHVLDLPVIVTEQNPRGLGSTIDELAEDIEGATVISKFAFSCCGEPAFTDALAATGRKQVLLCGIETHICVYQTAVGLIEAGYEVHVLADGVSSRTALNRQVGLDKMTAAGAQITSVETALFEILQVAEGDKFKQIIRIIK